MSRYCILFPSLPSPPPCRASCSRFLKENLFLMSFYYIERQKEEDEKCHQRLLFLTVGTNKYVTSSRVCNAWKPYFRLRVTSSRGVGWGRGNTFFLLVSLHLSRSLDNIHIVLRSVIVMREPMARPNEVTNGHYNLLVKWHKIQMYRVYRFV